MLLPPLLAFSHGLKTPTVMTFQRCECAPKQIILNKPFPAEAMSKRLITILPALLLCYTGARYEQLQDCSGSQCRQPSLVASKAERCLCSIQLFGLILIPLDITAKALWDLNSIKPSALTASFHSTQVLGSSFLVCRVVCEPFHQNVQRAS